MDQMLFSSFLTPAHYREWNMPGDFQIKTLIHTAAESVLRYVLSHTTSDLDSKPLLEFSLDKANFSQPFSAFFRETHSCPTGQGTRHGMEQYPEKASTQPCSASRVCSSAQSFTPSSSSAPSPPAPLRQWERPSPCLRVSVIAGTAR